MDTKASKLGVTVAAAVLGLGIPAVASAQTMPADQADDTTYVDGNGDIRQNDQAEGQAQIDHVMADAPTQTQSLAQLGSVSVADIAVVPLADMAGSTTYNVMQHSDPSTMAMLQKTLENVQVHGVNGTTGDQAATLSDYVQSIGVDPTRVVAVHVGDDGAVTLYAMGPVGPSSEDAGLNSGG